MAKITKHLRKTPDFLEELPRLMFSLLSDKLSLHAEAVLYAVITKNGQ